MDYIAFILLGMLTIFYGNKQLQQLVAGLYIALAIWYVYTIMFRCHLKNQDIMYQNSKWS